MESASAADFRRKRRQWRVCGFAESEEAEPECRGASEQGSETPAITHHELGFSHPSESCCMK